MAVSPICNRQSVRSSSALACAATAAECNSAIQQITNLRYAKHGGAVYRIKFARRMRCSENSDGRHAFLINVNGPRSFLPLPLGSMPAR